MREFLYGLIIGLGVMYGWDYFDVPSKWAYLTGATEYATKSTSGYGGREASRQKHR